MRHSDTYKGFVYQKKCAFLLLLRELAEQSGVTAFRMEHPKGDDFDLIYPEELRIFQTKDVQAPDLAEYLAKMWRRYTENIHPGEHNKSIVLGFIFSLDHGADPCFSALASRRLDDATLTAITSQIATDHLAQVKVRSQAEWQEFLYPITMKVLPVDDLERELTQSLGFIFLPYELPKREIEALGAEFLGRLDEVMQHGRQVPTKEIREVIDNWFVRYCHHHPVMRQRTKAALTQGLKQFTRPEPSMPSSSESGTV